MTTSNTYCPNTNPVQVLRDAADYLEANGWTRDEFFTPKYRIVVCGGEPEAFFTDEPPAACALGGIQIAVTGEPVDVFANGFNVTPATDRQFKAVLHATELVVDHLRREHNTAGLGSLSKVVALARWNDRNGRTAAEVISAMRDAAETYERSHGEVIP